MVKQKLLEILNNTSLREEEKIEQFKSIITSCDDLLDLNDEKLCLLHLAAEQGCMLICKWLTQTYPILLKAKIVRGSNVLVYAAYSNNETLFKFISSCRPTLLQELNLAKRHILYNIAHNGMLNLFIEIAAQLPKEWLISVDDSSTYPITWAALNGHVNIILWILDQLQDQPEIYQKHFLEAAQVAAMQDHVELIKELYILKFEWLNIPIYGGYTPIQAAASYGKLATVDYLLEKFPGAIFELHRDKIRLIDLAAASGNVLLFNKVLCALPGETLNTLGHQPNPNGLYLLHYAIQSGCLELVAQLLAAGANPAQKPKPASIDVPNDAPVHMAAKHENREILALLKEYGANINDEYDDSGLAHLHLAIIYNHPDMVTWLLKQGVSVHLSTHNCYKSTAIHIAAIHGRYNLLDLLLAHGAELNSSDAKGLFPLHLAAASFFSISINAVYATFSFFIENNALLIQDNSHKFSFDLGETQYRFAFNSYFHLIKKYIRKPHSSSIFEQVIVSKSSTTDYYKVLQWLLAQEVNHEQITANSYRNNACHMAAQAGQLENLIYLSEQGIPLGEANGLGYFILHLAAKYGHKSIVQWQLEKNVSVDQPTKNEHPKTAFILAVDNNRLEVLDSLKLYGANVNLAIEGYFPLAFAIKGNYPDIVKWLLQNGATFEHPFADKFYALQLAARFDSAKCLEILPEQCLEHWEQQDEFKHNPLTIAIAYNSSKTLMALMNLQPKFDAKLKINKPQWQSFWKEKTTYGWHPIHYLSLLVPPQSPIVIELSALEKVIGLLDINALTANNKTVLHLLIEKILAQTQHSNYDNYLRIIALLLKQGLNAHIRDQKGYTAYDYLFLNMSKSIHHFAFTESVLYIFGECGVSINTSILENSFANLNYIGLHIEDLFNFVLNHFPQLYSKLINILNNANTLEQLINNLSAASNLQQTTKKSIITYIKYGLLNGHTLSTSQMDTLKSIINSKKSLAYLAIGCKLFETNEQSFKEQDRIFILKQLSAFIIQPPTIFTSTMKDKAIEIFISIAKQSLNKDILAIATNLHDKIVID